MQNIKSKTKMLLAAVALLTLAFMMGCYKDKTVIFDTVPEITREVTFSGDIIPIFNTSCNLSGCHSPGGKSPDLSEAAAYNSLTSGGYINTSKPELSELYLWMTGRRGTQMPVGGINNNYNALVLAWIKQGAAND